MKDKEMTTKLRNLRDFWAKQAALWAQQEKDWHECKEFCHQTLVEIVNQRAKRQNKEMPQ